MQPKQVIGSLIGRLVVAFGSAFVATLTLALYPLALFIASGGVGGGEVLGAGASYYSAIFSRLGLSIIAGAAVVGFFTGAERMANIFSFFWGTHAFWSRLGNFLDESWNEDSTAFWLVVVLLLAAFIFIVVRFLS